MPGVLVMRWVLVWVLDSRYWVLGSAARESYVCHCLLPKNSPYCTVRHRLEHFQLDHAQGKQCEARINESLSFRLQQQPQFVCGSGFFLSLLKHKHHDSTRRCARRAIFHFAHSQRRPIEPRGMADGNTNASPRSGAHNTPACYRNHFIKCSSAIRAQTHGALPPKIGYIPKLKTTHFAHSQRRPIEPRGVYLRPFGSGTDPPSKSTGAHPG